LKYEVAAMRKFWSSVKVACIAVPAAAAAVGAHAQLVISDASTYNFSWDFVTPALNHLTGTGTVQVNGLSTGSLTLAFTLNNTGTVPGQGGDRLTAFGFGIDPNATGIVFSDPQGNDGGMVDAALDNTAPIQNIGNGILVEVCAWAGNNCNGGSNGGLQVNQSDSFNIVLTGPWGSSITLNPVAFKYQTGNGSFEFTTSSSSSSTSTSGESSGDTPEPGSAAMALLGLGLLGLGYRLRSRANAA
jgi:MYXO-CTERM domain-containing protein